MLVVGHPESMWPSLDWSSLSMVHHDLLQLLPNLDCAVSSSLSFNPKYLTS